MQALDYGNDIWPIYWLEYNQNANQNIIPKLTTKELCLVSQYLLTIDDV